MFYLRYLRNELVRRRTRTILTLLGLGLGVALVVAITSLSNGLDRAQKKTLNPLAGIGTDLTVTLQPQQDQNSGFGGPGGGGGNTVQASVAKGETAQSGGLNEGRLISPCSRDPPGSPWREGR